ncbi:MAG: hypothetical protein ABW189_00860 [Rickettsiales bacterium]
MSIFSKLRGVGKGYTYPLLTLGIWADIFLHLFTLGFVFYVEEKFLSGMRGRFPKNFAAVTVFKPFSSASPNEEEKKFLSLHSKFRRALLGATCLLGVDMAMWLYVTCFGIRMGSKAFVRQAGANQNARKNSFATLANSASYDSENPKTCCGIFKKSSAAIDFPDVGASQNARKDSCATFSHPSGKPKIRHMIRHFFRKWIFMFIFFIFITASFGLNIFVAAIFMRSMATTVEKILMAVTTFLYAVLKAFVCLCYVNMFLSFFARLS